ncbi:MAG: flagellar hook-basal body complex protein FliE [Pseudomonadales bacterium]|nr:flagellar hook-basal body complex protein FliE [Pseudomonadales bacterium]
MIQNDIAQVLAQMRNLTTTGAWSGTAPSGVNGAGKPDFSTLLAQSIGEVNDVQQQARQLTEQFQRGEPGTDLAQVMVAMEKASVSLEALKQVRNKLVDAYQEVMRMQI